MNLSQFNMHTRNTFNFTKILNLLTNHVLTTPQTTQLFTLSARIVCEETVVRAQAFEFAPVAQADIVASGPRCYNCFAGNDIAYNCEAIEP